MQRSRFAWLTVPLTLSLVLASVLAHAQGVSKADRKAIRSAVIADAKAYLKSSGRPQQRPSYRMTMASKLRPSTAGMLRVVEVKASINTKQSEWPSFRLVRRPLAEAQFDATVSGGQVQLNRSPFGWQPVFYLQGAGAR